MAWTDIMIPMVRYLIGDIDPTEQDYDDTRLQELVVITSQLIKLEIGFPTTYTLDFTSFDISPDPTSPTMDDDFVTLVSLKAAIVLVVGEAKKASAQAIFAKDGASSIDSRNINPTKLATAEALSKTYNQAKLLYQTTGSTGNIGQMIITPFRLNSLPNNLYPYPNIFGHIPFLY